MKNKVASKSSSKTIRLGVNDYIVPKINFLDYRLKEQINLQNTNLKSKFYNPSVDSTLDPQANVESNSIKKQQILLIDDNHFINEATKNVLTKVLKEAGSNIEIIVGFKINQGVIR